MQNTVAFRNRWRTLMMVYCTAENYSTSCALITAFMAQHRTAERSFGKSPVGAYLLRSMLVVIACVPIFMLGDAYAYGLFLPLLLMCFAIATVWLIRQLAWGVLFMSALIVVNILVNALSMRQSSFFKWQSYHRYEVLSGDNWALTVLAAVGLIYLAWLAIQSLRACILPALEADQADAGAG